MCCPPPCCIPPRRAAQIYLGVPEADAQGLDDFLKGLFSSICGCADDERRNKLRTKAINAARVAWPEANETCLSTSITEMIDVIGKTIEILFTQGPTQFFSALLVEVAGPLSRFIQCVFGQQAAARFDAYAVVLTPAANLSTRVATAAPQIALPIAGILQCLAPFLLRMLCPPGSGGAAAGGSPCMPVQTPPPTTPPPAAAGSDCCKPPPTTNPPSSDWKPASGKRC